MLLKNKPDELLKLRLARDLTRTIKRGHPWVFADALRQRPKAPAGTPAILLDNKKGRPIAVGFYDANSPLAFRVCSSDDRLVLSEEWADRQLTRALMLRKLIISKDTTGFRLIHGEGDGLPGLICDIYGDTGVIQLDGAGPEGFWDVESVADWIGQQLSLRGMYLSAQSRQKYSGRMLFGPRPADPIPFLENGMKFTADIIAGQKTGFFLDQRDNRQLVGTVAAGRQTLNLFGYSGGFSVAAGLANAANVVTVDLAAPALEAAKHHWQLNGLDSQRHQTAQADAFAYLAQAAKKGQAWDLVVVDPPSFATSREAVPKAQLAYQKLIAAAAAVTNPDGLLAAASCSSHINLFTFLNLCENGISQARRQATVLHIGGQPADHPSPLPFPEFRYLKFILMRVS
jgi:23S rRNA (cytosine1962-C5)-methyltransferase